MNNFDIVALLRKIFVEEDVQASKDSLVELCLLSPKQGDIEDKERDQVFTIENTDVGCSISRQYSDPEYNVLCTSKAKRNFDIIRLNIECAALEKQIEANKVVFNIFSLMRNLINNNVAVYYPVKVTDGVIYNTGNIKIIHSVTDESDNEFKINMIVKYTDKENNMVYCCEYHLNENQDRSYIRQTLSGI